MVEGQVSMWLWSQSSCACRGSGEAQGSCFFALHISSSPAYSCQQFPQPCPTETRADPSGPHVLHGCWVVEVCGDLGGNGARGGVTPLPRAPALFADSLACLKSCVNFTLGPVRPSVDQFHKYLPWFLEDPPNIKCPKG